MTGRQASLIAACQSFDSVAGSACSTVFSTVSASLVRGPIARSAWPKIRSP
jgi:hypothetical protein